MVQRAEETAREADGAGSEPRAQAGAFRVALPPLRAGEPPFEGPLDLLLHLVKEHEVEIFDIPIAKITESYLETLQQLRELDIDLAGEFLSMAAQLMLLKSRLLLPRTEVAEDAPSAEDQGVDPRAELVRRLLEYQKYKAAGEELGGRDILDRTVFVRRVRPERPAAPEGPEGLADVSVFKLIEALDRALANAAPEKAHEVLTDRLTINDTLIDPEALLDFDFASAGAPITSAGLDAGAGPDAAIEEPAACTTGLDAGAPSAAAVP